MCVVDLRRQRAARQSRELAATCRELTTASMTAELALGRDDWDAVHDAAERVLELAARFREQRRGLLLLGRAATAGSAASGTARPGR